jgi:hypothetical protein
MRTFNGVNVPTRGGAFLNRADCSCKNLLVITIEYTYMHMHLSYIQNQSVVGQAAALGRDLSLIPSTGFIYGYFLGISAGVAPRTQRTNLLYILLYFTSVPSTGQSNFDLILSIQYEVVQGANQEKRSKWRHGGNDDLGWNAHPLYLLGQEYSNSRLVTNGRI